MKTTPFDSLAHLMTAEQAKRLVSDKSQETIAELMTQDNTMLVCLAQSINPINIQMFQGDMLYTYNTHDICLCMNTNKCKYYYREDALTMEEFSGYSRVASYLNNSEFYRDKIRVFKLSRTKE